MLISCENLVLVGNVQLESERLVCAGLVLARVWIERPEVDNIIVLDLDRALDLISIDRKSVV